MNIRRAKRSEKCRIGHIEHRKIRQGQKLRELYKGDIRETHNVHRKSVAKQSTQSTEIGEAL